jgi:hypothetical protein
MLFRATALKRNHLALIFAVLGSVPVFGQAANSPIAFVSRDAITTTMVPAPQVGGSGSSSSAGDSQWLKVEFHYGVTTKDGAAPFLDSADFKVWIEGRDMFDPAGKPGEGAPVILTGAVTYVNIPAGKDLYGVVFVPPSVMARYSTSKGSSDFLRTFDVHVDIFVGGDKMDAIDKNKGEPTLEWYKSLKAIPGFVYRQDQCSFLMFDVNRYPLIKLHAPVEN